MLVLAATGHRPNKLGGYGDTARSLIYRLASESLLTHTPDVLITGMAQGWDMELAQAAADFGLEYWAYIPFTGQEVKWPPETQERYHTLLKLAHKVVPCSDPGYHPYKLQVRNERMMDDGSVILALWNGVRESGSGTWNALKYLVPKGGYHFRKPVINVWDDWLRIKKGII